MEMIFNFIIDDEGVEAFNESKGSELSHALLSILKDYKVHMLRFFRGVKKKVCGCNQEETFRMQTSILWLGLCLLIQLFAVHILVHIRGSFKSLPVRRIRRKAFFRTLQSKQNLLKLL